MQFIRSVTTKQSCYLLNPSRITEHKARCKEKLVADFKTALSDFDCEVRKDKHFNTVANDFYRETQLDKDCWEEMGSVIEHRKYLAELNEGELALSQMYM